MKKFYKILAILMLAMFSSCNLGLQESFDYVEDFPDEDPFNNETAWSYIQSEQTDGIPDDQGRKELDGDKLDFLIAAIKHVGYESLYNQTSSTNRTYLLLNNSAFTGSNDNDLINQLSGSAAPGGATALVNAEAEVAKITDPTSINILKAILRYHIVDARVDQVNALSAFDKNFVFKTLLPTVNVDENGNAESLSNTFSDINFRRDTKLEIRVNGPLADLPDFAKFEDDADGELRRHNFVFNNGIGHFIKLPARFQDYNLYGNLSLDN